MALGLGTSEDNAIGDRRALSPFGLLHTSVRRQRTVNIERTILHRDQYQISVGHRQGQHVGIGADEIDQHPVSVCLGHHPGQIAR
jgi:hypothetical protein